MFGKLRRSIGLYYFRKETGKTALPRRMTNIGEARSIGILYIVEDVPDFDIVESFVKELQNEHKEVKALGFVKGNNLVSRFLPRLSYDFFSSKDLNWFLRPTHARVADFIEKDFDILIDLNMEDFFPMKYISGRSKAFCRVGRFSEENMPFYDLMIELKPGTDMAGYISQIRHYLSIINEYETRK